MTGGEFAFVDRIEEMDHIQNFLKEAKQGRGRLLLIRGEAGCGKTRLIEEAAMRAEEKGLSVAIGTALAESVAPYHLWEEVLEELGLSRILEEPTPPKLLGLYFISPEGSVLSSVERDDDGIDSDVLSKMVVRLAKSPWVSKAKDLTGNLTVLNEDGHRVLFGRVSDFCLGAVLEGHEDEPFIADIAALAGRFESQCNEGSVSGVGKESKSHFEEPMRQLLESRKYEGIEYTMDDPKIRQSRLFEHIVLGLSRKAAIRPVCVVLDDLQWADPTSLSLLQYIARNTRDSSMLVLGAFRVEEVDARPHLRNVLSELEREELLDETDLIGLSREYLSDLTVSFLGPHALSREFLDLLWQETRGNPLFVREVLFRLEEDGVIAVEGIAKRITVPLESISIADRVREVVRQRLENLPKDDRKLLEAAATCGSRFTTTLLAKVTRTEEGKVLNGLRNMSRVHGLLRPKGNGYAFDHPAVQEVVYENTPEQDKHAYHREAAEWLDLAGGSIEEIGEHYYKAGDPRAGRKLKQAGEAARKRYANEEAITFYNEALELEDDLLKRMEVFKGLGSAYAATSNHEKSTEYYQSALELTDGKRSRTEILVNIGSGYDLLGKPEEALKFFTEALNLVEGEGCKEEAHAFNCLGILQMHIGDTDKGLELLKNSLRISERIGDFEAMGWALGNIGIIHELKGEYEESLECHQKSVEMGEKSDRRLGVALGLLNIGSLYFNKGEHELAIKYTKRSLEEHEMIGNRFGIALALCNMGAVVTQMREYEKAIEYFERSLEMNERLGIKSTMGLCLLNIGDTLSLQGEYDRALEYLEKSLKIYTEIGNKWGMSLTLCDAAEVYFEKRELGKAQDFGVRAFDLSKEIGLTESMAKSSRIFGMIHREREEWVESIENFEQSIRIFKEVGMERRLGQSYHEFGLMWKAKGEPEKAKELLMKALGSFEKVGMEDKADEVRGAIAEIKSS